MQHIQFFDSHIESDSSLRWKMLPITIKSKTCIPSKYSIVNIGKCIILTFLKFDPHFIVLME